MLIILHFTCCLSIYKYIKLGVLDKKETILETYNKRTSAEKKKFRKGESEFVSTNDVSRNIGHIGGQIGTQLDG